MYEYSTRPGGGLTRLLVSVCALTVVGVPVWLILTHGGSINLSLLPYAIPIAAIAIALLAALGNAVFGAAPRPVYYRRSNPAAGIVVGVLGVVAGAWFFFNADRDVHAYANDPSCASLFMTAGQSGACRVESARIESTYVGGGRSSTWRVVLALPDGTNADVNLVREVRGNVWTGARRGDEAATVQYFRNRIVQVETRSGRAFTGNMPLEIEQTWALLGIGAGLIGLISAGRVLLTSGIF
jgi:hypothetical protein